MEPETGKPAYANSAMLQNVYPDGLTWDTHLPRINLLQLIDWAVKEYADREFCNFMGARLTYDEAADLINKAAKGLRNSGVRPGAKVGLHMINSPYYPIMFFAVLKAGGTVVNLSPLDVKDEIAHKLKDSGADMVVTMDLKTLYDKDKALLDEGLVKKLVVCPLADMLPFLKGIGFRILKRNDIAGNIPFTDDNITSFAALTRNDGLLRMPPPSDPDDVAVLQYTGGTTGVPKGAMLTHFNLAANAQQVVQFFGSSPAMPPDSRTLKAGQESMLAALPFFHIFGLTVTMLSTIRIGGSMVILPDPRDVGAVMKAIDKDRPTIFPSVPRLLQAIAEHPKVGRYDMASLKAVITGGAALPPSVRESFERAVGCEGLVMQGYGLTEASPVVTSNPPHGENRTDSVGMPYPGTEIRIGDPENPDKTLAIGEVGEILIKGPQVMKGYHNRPDETAKTITPDGWLRTGDLGFLDAQGYIHIADRLKDLIIVNGFNVYPTKVEEAICKLPGVAECVVIGVNKGSLNESAKAFIRWHDNAEPLDADILRGRLKEYLSAYEMPRYIKHCKDELPKTAIGKPDRKALEAMEKAKAVPPPPKP